jgi:tetratricopeptide (TPR) repeat protein
VKSVLKLFVGGNAALICVLLALAVSACYLPSLRNDFINFDDPLYVSANPHVQTGLTDENVQWAFSTLRAGFWHPLTWISLMLDQELLGAGAFGYHLTSLVFHVANTILLFVLFWRLTGASWRSGLLAALFGLHPLHVESVAWVSERKDVLSTFFWLLSLAAYAEFRVQSSRFEVGESESKVQGLHYSLSTIRYSLRSRWYWLAILFFVCGLMSKSMVVTLPLTLLLLDFWPLGRLKPAALQPANTPTRDLLGPSTLQVLMDKLPFFLLSLAFGVLTIVAQRESGAVKSMMRYPPLSRFSNAIWSYTDYLAQTFWPTRLAIFYSYPKSFNLWATAAVFALGVAISAFVWWRARKWPFFAFGWTWYVVTLLPVIGLVQVGNQSHADRYTYVPLIGIFVMLVWGVAELARTRPFLRAAFALAGAVVLILLGGLTFRQLGYWKDSETAYRHAIAVTKNNELAENNLGTTLMKPGHVDEAIQHFELAVKMAPDYALAQANLGMALLGKGRLDESIAHSEAAVRLMPGFAGAHRNLGAALGAKGRVDEAIAHLQEAIRLVPDDAQAYYNLGVGMLSKRRFDDAIACFQQALRLKPNYADAQRNLQAAVAAKARGQ